MATKRLRRHNRRMTALLGLVLSTGLCLGALASATPAAAAPSISFAPTSGAAGTRVLITVSGVKLLGATAVGIAGVKAVFHVASSSQINAIVPAMPATVGPITVQIGTTQVVSSTMFTVVPGLVLSPATGPPGSAVNVSGTGFGHVGEGERLLRRHRAGNSDNLRHRQLRPDAGHRPRRGHRREPHDLGPGRHHRPARPGGLHGDPPRPRSWSRRAPGRPARR